MCILRLSKTVNIETFVAKWINKKFSILYMTAYALKGTAAIVWKPDTIATAYIRECKNSTYLSETIPNIVE